MAVAESNHQRMWNTTSSGYMFYGQVAYTCTRNNDSNTYTIEVTGIRAHGKEWNFTTYYEITLNGSTTTGSIDASGNDKWGKGGTNGDGWVPTNKTWKPVSLKTTVNGTSSGQCPAVTLSFRVYNNNVYYINADTRVYFSSSYSGNISDIVVSESGGPNTVWSYAGGAVVNSIEDNHGTFSVTTTMGADGNKNKAKNVHIYYSFTNDNPTAGGKDCYGSSSGSVSGRTVTFRNLSYPTANSQTRVYVRAYTISERSECNPHQYGSVESKLLTAWSPGGAPKIEQIKDNGNNTFNVVAVMGSDGIKTSASNVHIYYSYSNKEPSYKGRDSEGSSNGRISGGKVYFDNIPITKSGTIYVKPYSIWTNLHSRLESNTPGSTANKDLVYYGKPTASLTLTPTSVSKGQAQIKSTGSYNYRISPSRFEYDASAKDVSWSGDYAQGVTATHAVVGKLNDFKTFYVQTRRTNVPEMMSDVVSSKLDLRLPEIVSFDVVDIEYNGNECYGTLIFKTSDKLKNETLNFKFNGAKVTNGTTKSGATTKIENVKLNANQVSDYELTVSRYDYKFLSTQASITLDTRKLTVKNLSLTSALPLSVSPNNVSLAKSSYVGDLILQFDAIEQGNKSMQGECLEYSYKLICVETGKSCSKKNITLKSATSRVTEHIDGSKLGLDIGKTYKLTYLALRHAHSGLTSGNLITSNFGVDPVEIPGSVKIHRNHKHINDWVITTARIHKNTGFKRAVPYIYSTKDNKWHICVNRGEGSE